MVFYMIFHFLMQLLHHIILEWFNCNRLPFLSASFHTRFSLLHTQTHDQMLIRQQFVLMSDNWGIYFKVTSFYSYNIGLDTKMLYTVVNAGTLFPTQYIIYRKSLVASKCSNWTSNSVYWYYKLSMK